MSKQTFLIIPGVGDPKPGATVRDFAENLGASLSNTQQTVYLEEHKKVNPKYEDGTCTILTEEPTQETYQRTFIELHWGDLSQVKSSLLSSIGAGFRLIFGLRNIILPISEAPIPGINCITFMCNLIFLMLRGPILGLTIFLFILFLSSALLFSSIKAYYIYLISEQTQPIIDSSQASIDNIAWLFFSILSFILAVSLWKLRKTVDENSRIKNWTSQCVLIITTIATAIFLIGYFLEHTGVKEAIILIIKFLMAMWAVTDIVLLSNLILTMWLLIKNPNYRPPIIACAMASCLSLAFWVIIIPLLFISADTIIPAFAKYKGWSEFSKNGLPTIGWVWLGNLVTFMIFIGVWVTRTIQKKRNPDGTYDKLNPLARLILGKAICIAIGVITFGIAGSFLAMAILGDHDIVLSIKEKTTLINSFVIGALVAIIPILGLISRAFPFILDIVLDVVNYFKLEPTQRNHYWPPDEPKYSVRNDIFDRMSKTLSYACDHKESDDANELIIVAHSQGTVIASDWLAIHNKEIGEIKSHFSKITLVTMGSPLTHLYQHYFPKQYQPEKIDKNYPDWESLFTGKIVERWINIFRIDDYIGTHINTPATISNGKTFVENHDIKYGGHTGYFTDNRVMEIFKKDITP
jgi:hypothetical protein